MAKIIISVENLRKSFAEKTICQQESFGIEENDKIGLIGINGCGKTTLLRLLTGHDTPDEGKITFRKGFNIGYLPQIPELNPQFTVYEQIYFSDDPHFRLIREYHHLTAQLKTAERPEALHSLHRLIQEMEAADVWKIEVKAQSILTRLGFSDLEQPVHQLSGGQKRRLDLARVLMNEPTVLVLDEPTNHLDIDTIEWFQDYLINYPGTVIFVTHDRYFLDAVSNRILEMEDGHLRFYPGNYTQFLKRKELEIIDLERKETRRQAQLKKELRWLQRGARARTSKPKNHLNRVRELIDKSYLTTDAELEISFQTRRLGKTILELRNTEKSYSGKRLFYNFTHVFQKLERIGIIGPNGCGKTTLLKLITGEAEPDQGSLKVGINTHFNYFRQDTAEFDKDQTVLNYIRESADNIRTSDGTLHSASEMLKRFLFDGRMQQNKISSLSGGEKKRLYLLRSLMFGSNFIIMDEPTNDLDIRTLEILEDYLDAFKGCLLVVSHDRFFLDRVTDYLFIFEGDRIIKFPGNYSDYLLVKRYREETDRREADSREQARSFLPAAEKTTRSHKLTYREKRELEELEEQIADLEQRQAELLSRLEKEAASLQPQDYREISESLKAIDQDLNRTTERWLELEDAD
ncbi:MAG: ABC-F family ATP-binding cassette domain-containing protein [Candidatus Cloacimonetes bacterium]|nr:ABC-F family ATP-binding cassette domain-containing protein [Candidatus Cloacimonadota bacterium]